MSLKLASYLAGGVIAPLFIIYGIYLQYVRPRQKKRRAYQRSKIMPLNRSRRSQMYYQRIKRDESTMSELARHGSIFIADIQIQNMTNEDVTFNNTSLEINHEENNWESEQVFNGKKFSAGIKSGAKVNRKKVGIPTGRHGRFKKHTLVHANEPNDIEVAFYFEENIPKVTNSENVKGKIKFWSSYKIILGENFYLESDPLEFEYFDG